MTLAKADPRRRQAELGLRRGTKDRGRVISVDARKISSRPPLPLGFSQRTTDLLPNYLYSLTFLPTREVSRKESQGRASCIALVGSWPVVNPTGASPAEIRRNRSSFAPKGHLKNNFGSSPIGWHWLSERKEFCHPQETSPRRARLRGGRSPAAGRCQQM